MSPGRDGRPQAVRVRLARRRANSTKSSQADLEEDMDKKETKKPKNERKTRKRKTTGKSLEKDFASALKEVKEPLKELRGLWKDLKEGIGI